MKKFHYLIIALLSAVAQGAWAQTNVSTDQELRTALQIENVDIKVCADINLSNGTLTGGISNQNILTLRKNL
jgi:hypothetical protein